MEVDHLLILNTESMADRDSCGIATTPTVTLQSVSNAVYGICLAADKMQFSESSTDNGLVSETDQSALEDNIAEDPTYPSDQHETSNLCDESSCDGLPEKATIDVKEDVIVASEPETELTRLLQRRSQPLNELVYSERSYVKQLKIVKERYIPIIDDTTHEVPEDLASKWRILWGNWNQLEEWHSSFLERLERLIDEDPEQIPRSFIDYQARLRNIYSKYCENHRKAALIAEQHREFFDDLRVKVGDKEDVVSHLMQPVQRIMRYQLPMGEILKYTERAELSSTNLWKKALDIMKVIPKDTQLILEAARIDGFPKAITSLGRIRVRGDLLVANTSVSEVGSDGFTPSELKYFERRVFLFDQMLLITEESKAKKKDPFAQSTYQFKSAINVNKMKFECHWSYDLEDEGNPRLKFVLMDSSPGKEAVFVVDPGTCEVREQWVIQLRDIQLMQQEFLLALQDPTRFTAGGSSSDGGQRSCPSPGSSVAKLANLNKNKYINLAAERCNSEGSGDVCQKSKKQKWSFAKKQRSKTQEVPRLCTQISKEGGDSPCRAASPTASSPDTSLAGCLMVGRASAGASPRHQRCSSMERLPVTDGEQFRKAARKNSTSQLQCAATGGCGNLDNDSHTLKENLRKVTSNSQGRLDESTVTNSATGGKKKSLFSWFGKNK